jgi:hypothetical protein
MVLVRYSDNSCSVGVGGWRMALSYDDNSCSVFTLTQRMCYNVSQLTRSCRGVGFERRPAFHTLNSRNVKSHDITT